MSGDICHLCRGTEHRLPHSLLGDLPDPDDLLPTQSEVGEGKKDIKNSFQKGPGSIAPINLPRTLEAMTVSTQQRAIINERHTSPLEVSRPRLSPQSFPTHLPVTAPLHLVRQSAPSLPASITRVTPTFSIVTMDVYRFPINEARKNFGWKAGDYLSLQLVDVRARLRLSKTETEIQISPNGRIKLPFWVRRRLLIASDAQLLLQLSTPSQEACLSICSTAELFAAMSPLDEGNDQL